jgi:O-antigen ligase
MLLLMYALWYLVTPMRGWKRWFTRVAVVLVPLISIYVAVGWERGSRIFAPVRTIRGVIDTQRDRSAYWREVENWNIAMSLRERPVLGVGLGGEYTEYMKNDDVSTGFKEYREWPHNAVLGQLLLLGLFGFTAVWMLPAVLVLLAVRSTWRATTAEERVSGIVALGAVVACQVLAWGDTGAHFPQYKVFLALAVAVLARLAVSTGAWPPRRPA